MYFHLSYLYPFAFVIVPAALPLLRFSPTTEALNQS